VHERRTVRAEFAFGAIEPKHGLALAFGDRFATLRTVDIFPAGIDRLRPTFGTFPVVLESTAALILGLIDLTPRMQRASGSLRIERRATILSPGSSANGSSTSMGATSAFSGRSRERRS